jgi:hypothetical protein
MCLPRRTVLAAAAGVVVARPFLGWPAAAAGQPAIVPRSTWGPELVPTGPIPDEPDVRFLLVHHTVNANDYDPADVVGLLAGIYGFHTSAEKGWPDIAYNFLIDRFGTIYEGRTGSLAGAVAVDATGGSQGFAQLCCFIGDHSATPPSDAAMASMVAMLAFLGDRHGLDLSPGATATFTSRGSNRQPAGTAVTTPTISGHRDMSSTACPGDAAYGFITDGTFARLATAAQGGGVAPTTTTAAPSPSSSTTSSSSSTSSTTATTVPPTTSTATTTENGGFVVDTPNRSDGGAGWALPAAGVTAAAAVAGAILSARRRRL